ncbi:hypothetical protein BKA64DRAFT_645988 [Cadophora sp. MPI-SDFR-AT-0126]|nr:hypothetical protein BKA64DRAFT_645988 [Leotiomycetes sp. MPI-SDFR-AT-0126]
MTEAIILPSFTLSLPRGSLDHLALRETGPPNAVKAEGIEPSPTLQEVSAVDGTLEGRHRREWKREWNGITSQNFKSGLLFTVIMVFSSLFIVENGLFIVYYTYKKVRPLYKRHFPNKEKMSSGGGSGYYQRRDSEDSR